MRREDEDLSFMRMNLMRMNNDVPRKVSDAHILKLFLFYLLNDERQAKTRLNVGAIFLKKHVKIVETMTSVNNDARHNSSMVYANHNDETHQ
jgi:hypothetical protein